MPIAWVTGAEVLADVGVTAPSPDQSAWAELVADGTSAAFDRYLVDRIAAGTVTGAEDDLRTEARRVAAERYKSREAPFGVTGYASADGTPVRTSRDPIAVAMPTLRRYMSPGIG